MVKVVENNSTTIVVDGAVNLKKLESQNFARPDKAIILVPFFDDLSRELDKNLTQIINGIISTLVTENSIDSTDYFRQFSRYLDDFGLRMSEKMFFDLTRFFVDQMTKKGQRSELIKCCANAIYSMHSNTRTCQFNHNHMIIDWLPLYNLCMLIERKKIRDISLSDMTLAISNLSQFFAVDEQPKLWARLQEHLSCDSTTMKLFIDLCFMFLTVEGMTSDEHRKSGCLLWFDTLWDLYVSAEMNYTEAFTLVYKFKDIIKTVPDVIDWRPYYDVIFTKVTRSFAIPTNKSVIGDSCDSICVNSFAYFLANSIGGPRSSMNHFKQTLKSIEFNLIFCLVYLIFTNKNVFRTEK